MGEVCGTRYSIVTKNARRNVSLTSLPITNNVREVGGSYGLKTELRKDLLP
jgi:hypothetical protein